MSDIFGTGPRGCFFIVPSDASGSVGARIELPGSGNVPASLGDPMLVTSFSMSRNEVVVHNKTFGGKIYSYAFGNDPNTSTLDVSLTVCLGKDSGAAFGTLDGAFRTSRIYESLELAKFTVGSASVVAGYVVNLASQTLSVEHNLQDFSLRLALVEI